MKKYIFLFLVVFLIVLVLIYFYDRRELVSSRVFSSDGVYVKYPYFNNRDIDSYISNYVGNIIYNFDYRYKYYVSYSYDVLDSYIYLVIKNYKYYDNIYSYDKSCFNVYVKDSYIKRISCY